MLITPWLSVTTPLTLLTLQAVRLQSPDRHPFGGSQMFSVLFACCLQLAWARFLHCVASGLHRERGFLLCWLGCGLAMSATRTLVPWPSGASSAAPLIACAWLRSFQLCVVPMLSFGAATLRFPGPAE